ncbi:exported hypothetical protein [Cupriavidus necator]|uniref:Multidrug resistance protein MdtA-like barrel-sandwich hybrid domain-containing protein n=1 Tax=Cupriavidus necator TaxID=106590 RepID=A0A1K0ICM5_CUPNE|nr:exported hypothetical protein [Cupriavidus necator]
MKLNGPAVLRVLATGLLLTAAIVLGYSLWQHYMYSPWTRDGRVRADVINIAADVSGPVSRMLVRDNQEVRKGELLFTIDPERFRQAVAQAEAQARAQGRAGLAPPAGITAQGPGQHRGLGRKPRRHRRAGEAGQGQLRSQPGRAGHGAAEPEPQRSARAGGRLRHQPQPARRRLRERRRRAHGNNRQALLLDLRILRGNQAAKRARRRQGGGQATFRRQAPARTRGKHRARHCRSRQSHQRQPAGGREPGLHLDSAGATHSRAHPAGRAARRAAAGHGHHVHHHHPAGAEIAQLRAVAIHATSFIR